MGRLERAVVKDGRITSALGYVDPIEEPAMFDPHDMEVLVAWAIYRAVEKPPGTRC